MDRFDAVFGSAAFDLQPKYVMEKKEDPHIMEEARLRAEVERDVNQAYSLDTTKIITNMKANNDYKNCIFRHFHEIFTNAVLCIIQLFKPVPQSVEYENKNNQKLFTVMVKEQSDLASFEAKYNKNMVGENDDEEQSVLASSEAKYNKNMVGENDDEEDYIKVPFQEDSESYDEMGDIYSRTQTSEDYEDGYLSEDESTSFEEEIAEV